MAVKKCIAVRLESYIYPRRPKGSRKDFLREPPSPAALLLVTWESYMTPSGKNTQNHHYKQVEALHFDLKNA
jgi:hypothetical protein